MIVHHETEVVTMRFSFTKDELSDLYYFIGSRNSDPTNPVVDWAKHGRGEKLLLDMSTCIREAGIG
jgi:hypothetical protein